MSLSFNSALLWLKLPGNSGPSDESRLPRGMASPLRDQVQITPVADADTVDNFIVPTDIGSSLLTSSVVQSRSRSTKRRAAFESDEDEAVTPKRSTRPRMSESSGYR